MQDSAYPHPGTPGNTRLGTLHSPAPIPLVTPMDRYARSWMIFLQTNVCASERTPHAPSLMLQVAGRGYANFLELRACEVHDGVKVRIAPPRSAQDCRLGDAYIVGYYAPTAGTAADEDLGHRGGAKRRVGAPRGGL